jgi:UDP-N-acetylmuramoyl-L-alanyl-D-glutamate--2,6-diaminopimelate ligase
VKLSALAGGVPGSRGTGGDPEVTAVAYDSRRVAPGTLFVAVQGLSTDGNLYVEAARRKGAVAVASERPPAGEGPWLQVADAREALALLSAAVLGHPAASLRLVGVTGTNGKTTTTHLLDAALRAAGLRTGLIGTVQYRIGDRLAESVRTTPESSDLQELFREMADAGCTHVVMEVSSHSLSLKRVFGCSFGVAAFTNLTRDHLDFHGDMESYFAAKRLLFDAYLAADGQVVINLDDDRGAELARSARGEAWTFSLDPGRGARITATDLRLDLRGTSFRASTPVGSFPVHTPLLGRFNVQNVLAALGASLALGLPPEAVLRGLGSVTGVPGRLERVEGGQPFTVVVDYAHTDDALKNLLETVRELSPRRLITVFGCGGDRDRSKRPLMGAVAARLSDVAVVTSDNPRSEPPEAILEEIQRGMNGGRRALRHAIVDRKDAITFALEMAEAGDAVVIAGKGHETYQVLRDRTVPFDDRQVARQVLSRMLTGRKA